MSGESGDKTEKPSGQKLSKARGKGQVPRSRDLAAAVGLLASLQLMIMLAPGWLDDFRALFAVAFADLSGHGRLDDAWHIAVGAAMRMLIAILLPLFAIPACIVLGSLYPGGWVFSKEGFMPKSSRFNPIQNLKRLMSLKHYGTFGISVLKVATLIATLWFVMNQSIRDFLHLQSKTLAEAIRGGTSLTFDASLVMAAVLVVFAFLDAPFQKLMFLRDQRMSKKEVKDEHKNNEGSPEVKSRLRQLQRQAAHRGLLNSVPGADVVIVNPTHYAVALKYDASRAEAPFVVAKGVDDMAMVIRRLAREHNVEVLTLPPLARAIYNTSQVNQQIPAALYRAVAQVLNYVMQLHAFRQGQRGLRPDRPSHIDVPETLVNR
ncbi:Flagellar biosynthetic protein flhB [Pandoraea pulmonicola]|uniref:Flagellar biosynthetic protein FlhB n=1 Tax=Pandoraea pulmonicola TaxID=93221 RepID=A0AAJ5CZZ6_PANPU|nr:Flagellar biosynthetic protein flhB [Pandoraea pulmonicola]